MQEMHFTRIYCSYNMSNAYSPRTTPFTLQALSYLVLLFHYGNLFNLLPNLQYQGCSFLHFRYLSGSSITQLPTEGLQGLTGLYLEDVHKLQSFPSVLKFVQNLEVLNLEVLMICRSHVCMYCVNVTFHGNEFFKTKTDRTFTCP